MVLTPSSDHDRIVWSGPRRIMEPSADCERSFRIQGLWHDLQGTVKDGPRGERVP